jgi:hypothetical protein
MNAPTITPEGAATLDDRWINRLIDQWLALLAKQSKFHDDRLCELFAGGKGRMPGNPKGQAKWVKRFVNRLGSSIIQTEILPGKRAKFHFFADILSCGPALKSAEDFCTAAYAPITEDKPVWLYASRLHYGKEGPTDVEVSVYQITLFAMTKHAILRLIQRGGALTVSDLEREFKKNWKRLLIAELYSRERRGLKNGEVFFVPLSPSPNGERLFAVMQGPEKKDHALTFILKTVLYEYMIPEKYIEPLNRLDEFMENCPSGAANTYLYDHQEKGRNLITAVIQK